MKDWRKMTRVDFVTTFRIYQKEQGTFGCWERHHETAYQCIKTQKFHTVTGLNEDFFSKARSDSDCFQENLERDAWIKSLEAMKKLKEQYGEGYHVVLADFECKIKSTVL